MNDADINIFEALALIEKEKGISKEYMIERIKAAMITAYKRDFPANGEVEVRIDEKSGKISLVSLRTVVEDEELTDEDRQVSLTEARSADPTLEPGDKFSELLDVDPTQFGRIAAQSAKQVIIQGIREAERSMVYDEFTSKRNEILTGIVSRIDMNGNILIKISSNSEYTEASLPAKECIPHEEIRVGDRIKVYVMEIRKANRGPQVTISRTHPGLVKRLFELEVPEINDGTVQIRNIVREAGSRTKMAVFSTDPEVDPVGACVGPKGGRVAAIVNELNGEKIDIIKYSEDPTLFIAAALSPAEVVSVEMLDEETHSARAIVPDSQLSLAIGKEGQNARLAARLTGCKIDIRPQSAAE